MGGEYVNRVLRTHDGVIRKGVFRTVKPKKKITLKKYYGPKLYKNKKVVPVSGYGPGWWEGKRTTFCNRAVADGLGRMGIPTKGIFRRGKVSGLTAKALRRDTFPANTQISNMRRSSQWNEIKDNRFVQELANLGVGVVAGYRNPKGHGHVALVRPGRWRKNQRYPWLSNVGSPSNTVPGGITADRSWGNRFRYYVNRKDPRLNQILRNAARETSPGYRGVQRPSTRWMSSAIGQAIHETGKFFTGKPSPRTQYIKNMGILDSIRHESRRGFVGPPSSATMLYRNTWVTPVKRAAEQLRRMAP